MNNGDLTGFGTKFRTVPHGINMVAAVDSAGLIGGETGTGKGVIARAIHEGSTRRQSRLVGINRAAIPDALLDGERCGHERGSFTGAVAPTPGRLQIVPREEQSRCERVDLDDDMLAGARFEGIVGSSQPLLHAFRHVSKVAPTDCTVLITGESGTGKELIAHAIHKRSRRADRPFIRVNCAAIPQSLIASELFGHEKGAFTGATERRIGRFELANGGTIFLDEIGDIPADMQIALLRVLQEREFERVGGGRTVSVDVRVVAATNRDLKAAVEAGTFRLDLFYRLNVFPVRVPSLREREDDIPLLAKHFIERYARSTGKQIKSIDRKTLELLQGYHWPGNIRELQNVIERAVILCDGATLSIDESSIHHETLKTLQTPRPLSEALTNTEKTMIEAALEGTGGRVSGPLGAAMKLGIPRSTLESRIRSLQINKYLFRSEASRS